MTSKNFYPINYTYIFKSHDEYYEAVCPQLTKVFDEYLADDKDEHFHIAIDEMICNAVRYAVPGKQLEITMNIRIWDDSISCSVKSDTQPWDAAALQKRLRSLNDNENVREMDWGEYIGADAVRGRGVFLILMTAEYFIVNPASRSATIICRRPFKYNFVSKKIKNIVQRFLIENEGVIT